MTEQTLSATGEAHPSTPVACFHCGDTCRTDSYVRDSRYFCCAGCLTVYQLIAANNLGTYYALESCPGRRPLSDAQQNRFAWLDNAATTGKLLDVNLEGHHRVTLSIPHIHCSSCVWILEKLYQFNSGIRQSRVDLMRKEVAVSYDDTKISLRELAELLASLGYEPRIDLASLNKKEQSTSFVSSYVKIGVAGFAFGNVMLFSFPEYLATHGLTDTIFGKVFGYANLILSVPVLLYSSAEFFTSAWNGLRNKFINIDFPIALGLLALFVRSCVEVIFGLGAGFFDSFSGLVFFLLIGRLFQTKTYQALAFDRDYRSYLPVGVIRRSAAGEETVSVESLSAGDVIVIRNQELIPVDGILTQGVGRIDYSFLTGESAPHDIVPGGAVMAGGRQLGSAIVVTTQKEISSTYLARLWRADCFQHPRSSRIVAAANVAAKYFTAVVLLVSAATAIFWWRTDSGVLMNAVTAVLMVACPCALAMASPYVFGTAMRILGRNGVFLRSAESVEHLSAATHVVFDKTGTLTLSQSTAIASYSARSNDYTNLLVASLARQSLHPVSRYVYDKLGVTETLAVTSFEEVSGSGIAGIVDGHQIRLGSLDWAATGRLRDALAGNNDSGVVWYSVDAAQPMSIPVAKVLRPGLKEIVGKLSRKFKLSLLSGDDDSSRVEMTSIFGDNGSLYFRRSAEDKLTYVRSLQHRGEYVVMVGDGLNDAGALRQADIGVSIVEHTSAFSPSSDVILAGDSFGKLPAVFGFSRRSMSILYICFAISLAYNVVGLAYAVSGVLTPLVAAVLMPLSSASVLAVAVLGTRFQAAREGLV